jgi:hypothetical protein
VDDDFGEIEPNVYYVIPVNVNSNDQDSDLEIDKDALPADDSLILFSTQPLILLPSHTVSIPVIDPVALALLMYSRLNQSNNN